MKKNKENTYLPKVRTDYKSKNNVYGSDDKKDNIVVNNIATQEFDYTEHLDEDI